MSNPQAEGTKAADPLEQWRELRDAYVDIWAKASGEVVTSEAYAQASGTMLEAILTTSSPFRDAQKKAMVSALEQCNMPSRDDYVRLADRLGNLELLLDDMDAKLMQIHQLVARASSRPASGPQLSATPRPAAAEPRPAAEPPAAPKAPAPSPAPELAAAPQAPAARQLFAAPETSKTVVKSAPRKTPVKNSSKKGSK
jgi:hypothetical protein